MDRPLITVIIPAFNAEKFIVEAVESVYAQDYAPIEIIVIDDGSSDSTGSVVRSLSSPVRYIYQGQAGAAAARNTGIRAVKGDLVTFLDADDVWASRKLHIQLAALEADPAVQAVFGHARNFVEEKEGQRKFGPEIEAFVPGTLLIRMQALSRVGWFEEGLKRAEVVDFYIRLKESGLKIAVVPETLLYRRVHGENLGFRARSQNNEYLHIVKQFLDRKRQGEG